MSVRPAILLFAYLLTQPLPAIADGDSTNDIVTACERLVVVYALARDQQDADAYVDVFTEDARLVIQGQTFNGRDAIRQRTAEWSETLVARHLMTTIQITPVDNSTATGIAYTLIMAADVDRGTTGPIPVESFRVMGEYHDVFKLTEDGWKIARREFKVVFSAATPD